MIAVFDVLLASISTALLLRWCGWRLTSEVRREFAARAARAQSIGAPKKKEALRVLTHNIWAHYFVAAPQRGARMRLLVELLRHDDAIDVLSVQELFVLSVGPFVFCPELLLVARELEALGFVHQSDPLLSARSLFQSSGLATFSKVPIRDATFTPFETTAEFLNNKGFERIALGDSLTLFNTHFDSRLHTQAAQRDQIAAAVRQTPGAVLAVGDWNIDANDAATFGALSGALAMSDAYVAELGLKPTFRPAKPSNALLFLQQLSFGLLVKPAWPSKRGAAPRKHDNHVIDHAFVRGLRARNVVLVDVSSQDGLPLSDHLGIALTVEPELKNLFQQ